MPFDGTDYGTKPAQPDAAYLSRVLREGPDGPLWPVVDGRPMPWNYNNTCLCGMGVAQMLWPRILRHLGGGFVGDAIGIGSEAGFTIFEDLPRHLGFIAVGGDYTDEAYERVTPLHVADALDVALAGAAA